MAALCRWQLPATFNFALDVVDRWAAEPGKLALIAENAAGESESFTFEDISRKSSQLANLLWEQGIRQGDRVIVLLPRIPQWQIRHGGSTAYGRHSDPLHHHAHAVRPGVPR